MVTSAKKTKKPKPAAEPKQVSLHSGIVHLEFLKLQIPIFKSDEDRVKSLSSRGFPADPVTTAYMAFVSVTSDQHGVISISAVIPPNTDTSTLVHEAVHIVDFAMEQVGIDPDPANTETRAYMTQHVWEQLLAIQVSLQAKAKKANAKKWSL